MAVAMSELISKALSACATTYPQKAKKPPSRGNTPDHIIHDLIQQKSRLLNSLKKASKTTTANTWRKVQLIQKKIQGHAHRKWEETHTEWWEAIGDLDDEADAGDFWEIANRFKAKQAHDFPTIIKDEKGTLYNEPNTILDHTKNYYIEISLNDDEPAKTFYASRGMQEKDVAALAKTTENKYREMMNELKTTSPPKGPCTRPITRKEFRRAISKLKTGKATGLDNIPSEALKHLPEEIMEDLLCLYNLMWETSTTPKTWNIAVTILLHKKDDRMLIKNYRPITLLTALFKTWESILEQRVRTIIEGVHPPDAQMGSRKKNSSAFTIMTKLSLMRQAKANDTPFITLQIDMNKAYNRVNHQVLWLDLYELGIRGHLLKSIMSTYKTARETIRIGCWDTDHFTLPNGLRQGSVLSPVLYILYTIKLIKKLQATNTGIKAAPDLKIPCLMFVDDLATLALTLKETLSQYLAIQAFALTHRCIINTKKSGASTSGDLASLSNGLAKAGLHLRTTAAYVHLGAMHEPGKKRNHIHASPAVMHRLSKARAMLAEMRARGLGNKKLHHHTTLPIIKKRILSTASFGLSSLDMTAADICALQKISADAIRLALQWTDDGLEKDEWVILEANIPSPIATTLVTDIATWVRAKKGRLNPLTAKVLAEDDELHAHVIRTCRKWNTPLTTLFSLPNDKLHKALMRQQMGAPRMSPGPNEETKQCSKQDLGLHLGSTAMDRLGLEQTWVAPLMKFRSILRHGHRLERTQCKLCGMGAKHDPAHVITECAFSLTSEMRALRITTLSPSNAKYLTELSTCHLTGIMGGQAPPMLSRFDTKAVCMAALAIFNTSPLYHPV